MAQDIARLGPLVRARREELGLSQEDVAALGGPSTTTLSKIENGEAKAIRLRTARDLDRALGWRRGSTEDVLYQIADPRVTIDPDQAPEQVHQGPPVPTYTPPLEPEGDSWLQVRAERDDRGRRVIVGISVSTDPEGVRSEVELRYWPGDRSRAVSMGGFPEAVYTAHQIALDNTSIFRAAKEVVGNAEHPAPMNEAGETPAADDSNVHEFRGRLVSRETWDEDAATFSERAVANEDQTLEEEGIAQLEDP
ncbi:helix-turn-helix domain-containing protein [Oerskovia rustica]|uniref:Helix-turn-helix domain-containing protein n=1 Tax=Oerskovia rustica TaxID=2762237 RepID=A0ABR8RPA8_9CELL|nr:helix-turn-helix transcriptional regulator [Oerskovia rustica]MBD7949630.1 helix-turn-helix domain-containing protein [Oerskovia rustica]